MRPILLLLLTLQSALVFAQKPAVTSEILSPKQINNLFSDSLKKALPLPYPVFRGYKYTDKSGEFYCLLTESMDSISNEADTFNHHIKAVILKAENKNLNKVFELNDGLVKNGVEENTIRFWTKYAEFKDHDNDSLADLIIVYGTLAMNGYDDGRVKICIYYKGHKVLIRHQNGVLDFERETQVDKEFYDLPVSLQNSVKQKMELMVKNSHAIFPYGWQTAMKNKKTSFSERK